MKIHYWGKRDGYAYCGASVPTSQLTAHRSGVTCKLCQRHIDGGERKPGGEKKRNTYAKRLQRARKLESLMRKAFVSTEGELRVRLDALKLAMQGWEAADRDDLASAGEGLRTEAQAIVDYLEGKPSN